MTFGADELSMVQKSRLIQLAIDALLVTGVIVGAAAAILPSVYR